MIHCICLSWGGPIAWSFGGNLEHAFLLLLQVVQLHLAGSSGLSKRGRVESFVLSGPPPIRDERKRL